MNKDNIPNIEFKGYELFINGVPILRLNGNFRQEMDSFKRHSKIITEAFNVFSKTGMTPKEFYNFYKGYKSHLSKNGSPQTYYVAKCSELEKQIEQLQQERDELREELMAYKAVERLQNNESLNTPQEENK